MAALAAKAKSFARPLWFVRDKDCCVDVAQLLGIDCKIVSVAKTGMLGNGLEMMADIWRMARLTRDHGVDLWFSKYGAANIAAALTGAKSLSFNDDDADIVPLIAWTSYPFARKVLVPQCTRMGRFQKFALPYPSYHELFYLHPNRFTPDPGIYDELGLASGQPYALLRLSALTAHHDLTASGISQGLLHRLVSFLSSRMKVFITSEKPLARHWEQYRLPTRPHRIHHVLAFAQAFAGDSQTMAAEAAVLGTPSFRLSSFVGRISYLDELEKYGLSFGFAPKNEKAFLEKISQVLAMENRKEIFAARRLAMLRDKVDPVPICVSHIARVLGIKQKTPA